MEREIVLRFRAGTFSVRTNDSIIVAILDALFGTQLAEVKSAGFGGAIRTIVIARVEAGYRCEICGDRIACDVETRNDAFAEFRLGDANLDGKVDVIDVSGVQLHAAGKLLIAEARPFADVNKDDLIDVTDATLIQLKVAGKIEF